MIGTLIGVIFVIIVIGVVWWAIFVKLLPILPLPEPFRTIIHVLSVVLLVIIVLWVIATLLLPLAGVSVPGWLR